MASTGQFHPKPSSIGIDGSLIAATKARLLSLMLWKSPTSISNKPFDREVCTFAESPNQPSEGSSTT